MKLIFAIVRDSDFDSVTQGLTSASFRVTRCRFHRRSAAARPDHLLIGLEADQVEFAIQALRQTCTLAAQGEKRATIFVVPVDRFEQI